MLACEVQQRKTNLKPSAHAAMEMTMWSLEIGASAETTHSAAIQRAHDIRAATFAKAIAIVARPAVAFIRRRRQRSTGDKHLPGLACGGFDAAAGAFAAISSAGADSEPSQSDAAATARPDLQPTVEPPVLIERSGTIATLVLNRRQHLNAINYAMVERLQIMLDDIEQDDAIRAVILTGAGRAFSAGADIHEFSSSVAAGRAVAVRDFVSRGQALTARIERFPKPVIAAINGIAFGGGCEILEAAHLAVAADTATFAKPEIRLQMPPTFGGTQRLPRIAGRKRALEHLLTGEPFDAERAFALGLVNWVVPYPDLMGAAHRLAQRATRSSPPAVAAVLEAVSSGADRPISEALLEEKAAFAGLVGTSELRDGLAAWRDRPRGPR